ALTSDELNKFQEDIALWVYQKGLPLSIFDDGLFNKVIEQIRPGIRSPSRNTLTGKYLDHWSVECQTRVDNFLQRPNNLVTLGCDSWTDTNMNSVINFVAMNHKTTILMDCIITDEG
ncbi:MAG: hypothetical protein ACK559_27830, partial [bacterium]